MFEFTRHIEYESNYQDYPQAVFLINNSKSHRAYYDKRKVSGYHQFSICLFDGEGKEANNLKQVSYGHYEDDRDTKCLAGTCINALNEGVHITCSEPFNQNINEPLLREFIDYCYSNHIVN